MNGHLCTIVQSTWWVLLLLHQLGVVGQMAGLQVEDPQGVQQVSCGVWVKLKPCVGGQCAMYITAYHPQDSTDTHKISSIIHPLHVAMVTFGLRMGNAPTVIHHNMWYVLHAAWSVARNSWMCVARYTPMTRQSFSWCQLHQAYMHSRGRCTKVTNRMTSLLR